MDVTVAIEYARTLAESFDHYLSRSHQLMDGDELLPFLHTNDAYLLGKCFNTGDVVSIKSFSRSLLWFTYRSNFLPIGGSQGPTSDQGWGCMIRCGQMLLAQALLIIHLGKEWRWKPIGLSKEEKTAYCRILRMFQDKKNELFSIHQLAQMGVSDGKPLERWLGPNAIAQILKKLVVYDDWTNLSIHVAMDNVLISDDVRIMASYETGPDSSWHIQEGLSPELNFDENSTNWRHPILLIVPLRLGLTAINECYLKAVQEFFKLSQCMGILGGRPNHAVYFYGISGDKLLYLDPHKCQEFIDIDPDTHSDSFYPLDEAMSFCSPVQSIDESPLNSNEQFTEVKVVDTEPDIIQRYADLGMRKSPSTSSTEQFIKISLPSNSESIDTFDGPDERYLPSVNGSSEGVSMYIEANAADTLMSNTNEYPTIRNTNDDFSCHNNDLKQTYDDFDTSFHCTKLLSMDFKSLDPSLALAFLCKDEMDYEDLIFRLKNTVLSSSTPPLFEILENRPKGWPQFIPYTLDHELTMKEYDDFGDVSNFDEQFEILDV